MQDTNDKHLYESVSEWLKSYNSVDSDKYQKAKAKALIVTSMLPIVKRIARTIARRSYDPIEDLVQAGSLGLLKAIDSYTPQINKNFRTYAGYLIIGEMKHYLRDKLETVRVPRHIQELSYRINTFTRNLTPEELDSLTSEDVAEALNISKKEVDFVMDFDRRNSTVSLDSLYNTKDDSFYSYEEILTNNNYKEKIDIEDAKIILKENIQKLPTKLITIVNLYYYEDLSQKEIAEKLNLTQMQVSRSLKKSFSLLYKMLADNMTGI